MNKRTWILMTAVLFVFGGCASLKEKVPLNIDQTAQAFFDDLQRSNNTGAYGLFGKGLSQRVSFEQFDQFMQTLRQKWGRIESDDTEVLPFHRRAGEDEFIPLNVTQQQVKRYTFNVKYEDAQMNFDMTLAPEGGVNKIVWFSIWGSSIYMTPDVQEKIQKLFSKSEGDASVQ